MPQCWVERGCTSDGGVLQSLPSSAQPCHASPACSPIPASLPRLKRLGSLGCSNERHLFRAKGILHPLVGPKGWALPVINCEELSVSVLTLCVWLPFLENIPYNGLCLGQIVRKVVIKVTTGSSSYCCL